MYRNKIKSYKQIQLPTKYIWCIINEITENKNKRNIPIALIYSKNDKIVFIN